MAHNVLNGTLNPTYSVNYASALSNLYGVLMSFVGHLVMYQLSVMLLLEHSGLAVALFVKIHKMAWYSKSKYVFLTAILQHLPSDQVHVLVAIIICTVVHKY